MNIPEFRGKWKANALKESAAAKEHFLDLCHALGVPTPAELDKKRNAWLNPPDASEAELKKRTLTNLYNARPAWLQHRHAALDRAVWAAYGWSEDPAETDDETILTRLLALNGERAAPSSP